jgi:hypothetical protein
MKKHTATKAKLPDDEKIIGVDAPKNSFNKQKKKAIYKLIKEIKSETNKGSE